MTKFLTRMFSPIYLIYIKGYYSVDSFMYVNIRWKSNLRKTNKHFEGLRNSDLDASKHKLISKMNFLCTEDALPFYKLSTLTLLRIHNTTQQDDRMGFCKNRLYYISSRLKCPPEAIRETIAKRTFVYNMSFDWLESSLNVLLGMGISSDRILRDLWVLKYHHKTIYERLIKVKSVGIENLYPWMVRCTDEILDRYIEILQETKNILGENESTHGYLAKRLNISLKDVEEICEKVPALKTIRVTKLKPFLDFLINEGFTTEDIAKRPRVLTASQETIKLRLEKLRNLGLKEINLNILSRSRKNFQKYFESLESVTNQNL
ncbi:transcription termination factor, mitochondrial isoform X1 [Battus philenor]|uniref:transcription termination factor, mitochondrial isoform X1 n=1 Tax=Battus philenor TaxID=42288 RepID=UPI0035CF62AC